MPKNPEKELEEFLAPLPAWLQSALEEMEYVFSSVEENLESINNQNKVTQLRPEYERILHRLPGKWNEYCKRARERLRKIREFEEQFLNVPKAKAGAPRKDALAQEAIALHQAGKNFPQIAAELSKKHQKAISSEAIRKLVKRFPARTN